MASSEPIVLPPVAGCDSGDGGAEGSVDVEFIDFGECSLEERTDLCRILRVGAAPGEEQQGGLRNSHCDFVDL